MAFLVYFFVLLVMAGSVLFGLDWVKSPLDSPAAQHRTHVAANATKSKSEHQPKAAPNAAAVPIGRTQAPSSVAQSEPAPAPVVAQRPAKPSEPEPVFAQAPAEKPAPAPEQKQAEQKQADTPLPPVRPERVAEQQPAPAPAAAPAAETTGAPAPVETHKTAAAPAPVETQKTAAAPAPVESQKAEAKRAVPEPAAPQTAASAAAKKPARVITRRKPDQERSARVPSWAIRGAEAAHREQAEQRQYGAPERQYGVQERVPSWAMQGAEAARREAEETQARPAFRPFWVSRDDGGWR